MVAWSAGVILFFMVLMGANLLVKSLSKIQAMEESIQTLSGYVTAQEQNNREFVVSDALRDKETAERGAKAVCGAAEQRSITAVCGSAE